MSKSGASFAFVPRADVVSNVDGNYRGVVIFDGNHAQSICHARLFPIDMDAAPGLGQHHDGKRAFAWSTSAGLSESETESSRPCPVCQGGESIQSLKL